MHGGCISGENFLSPQRYNYWCAHTYAHTYRITTIHYWHQGVLKIEGFLSFYLLTFIQALITLYSCMTCFSVLGLSAYSQGTNCLFTSVSLTGCSKPTFLCRVCTHQQPYNPPVMDAAVSFLYINRSWWKQTRKMFNGNTAYLQLLWLSSDCKADPDILIELDHFIFQRHWSPTWGGNRGVHSAFHTSVDILGPFHVSQRCGVTVFSHL